MIVDDDTEFLTELRETLALSGYEVSAVNEAREAVLTACEQKPDIILLDLKMQGMTGFEVAKKLRANPDTNEIPIIAMSGYFNEEKDITLFDFFNITHYLQKPFNPLDIVLRIESLLRGAEAKVRRQSTAS
jgi:DNA-binding response OmpR family regulator